jgi:hypothetical protein
VAALEAEVERLKTTEAAEELVFQEHMLPILRAEILAGVTKRKGNAGGRDCFTTYSFVETCS